MPQKKHNLTTKKNKSSLDNHKTNESSSLKSDDTTPHTSFVQEEAVNPDKVKAAFDKPTQNAWQALWKFKGFRIGTGIIGAIILVSVAGWLVLTQLLSDQNISFPDQTHQHFRVAIVDDEKKLNFAESQFQTDYKKDFCSGLLSKEPFHFHDDRDQIVHLHWKDLTGGQFLKDYGVNTIGGFDDTLGYKLNKFPIIERVAIHGQAIPKPASNDKFYIYTGDNKNYIKRTFSEFQSQTLSMFFDGNQDSGKTDEFLGNVAIFIQSNEPSESQIKDVFTNFSEIDLGHCSG